MVNLLKETLEILSSHGKVPGDVRWVGIRPPYLEVIAPTKRPAPDPMPFGTWADFEKFADFEYNAGFGGNEVQCDLVVVGADWWLERGEYDGSE